MKRLLSSGWIAVGLVVGGVGVPRAEAAPPTPAAPLLGGVWATINSTLATGGKQIHPFAFDGDPNTYFESAQDAKSGDQLTLVFDTPVKVDKVSVVTGKPDGSEALDSGQVQFSADGVQFKDAGRMKKGAAEVRGRGESVKAVRLSVSSDLKHPLAIREITIASDPAVLVYRYPVEFTVNTADAPDMKEWADKVADACVRAYPLINQEINGDGYRPSTRVSLTLKADYNGVAETGGDQITGSVRYFKTHPDDVGAFVHETVHVAQAYHSRGNPGWLVEGVADYVRWVKWEAPGKLRRANAARARYNGSYQTTAQFLAFLVNKYDRDIVNKLSQAMRKGQYQEALFQQYTGKTAQDLDTEWRATLQ